MWPAVGDFIALAQVFLRCPLLSDPLSDQDLLARLDVLAGKEREASVELVAHLAALDGRPGAYAAQGEPPMRPGTDKSLRKPVLRSRDVPRPVKRAAWRRDAGQCAFLSPTGRRCSERTFLEFHHVQAYAKKGPATVGNISLRCWLCRYRHRPHKGYSLRSTYRYMLWTWPRRHRRSPGPRSTTHAT